MRKRPDGILFSCSGGEAVVSTEGMKWELDNVLLDSVNSVWSNTALDNCFRAGCSFGSPADYFKLLINMES